MTNQEVFNRLKSIKRGRYVALRKKKVLGHGVEKVSELVIRLGVNYANMKINEGKETGSLPWGKWVPGYEHFVIEHKGAYYLRVTSSYSQHVRSYYFLNGASITRDEAAAIVGERKLDSHPADVYNIRFENLLDIRIGH